MSRLIFAALSLTAAFAAPAWDDDCAYTAQRKLELDAANVKQLVVEAAAGDLDIRGEAGLTRIVAEGRACADEESALEQIQLISRDGDTPTIVAEIPESDGGWFGGYNYLDIKIRVPAALALTVRDSSGDIAIDHVAALDLTDSSGDVNIREVAGEVLIDDSSGDLDVQRVGAVTVRHDSSGDIGLDSVRGDATVESDSSGDIRITRVEGNALVRSDSSGGIEFDGIKGKAEVGNDSSGEIVAEHIGGDFVVRSDGSGGIRHSEVSGQIDIPEED